MPRFLALVPVLVILSPLSAAAEMDRSRLTSLPPDEFVDSVNSAEFTPGMKLEEGTHDAVGSTQATDRGDGGAEAGRPEQSALVVKLQVLLDRAQASPGVIDGFSGDNLRKAITAFQEMKGLEADGDLDEETWRALAELGGDPALTKMKLTAKDVKGPYTAKIPSDYGAMARLKRLGYRDAAEKLAERFHVDVDFLRQINPKATFEAGSEIFVPVLGKPAEGEVTRIVADKGRRQLFGYGREGKLIVSYPATIGSPDLPSPTGTHKVSGIARNPVYNYDPDLNFKQGNNNHKLKIPPGPNNPVGVVWIDLTEPTYGIHGTPEPSRIDKTNSHGCIRLTNWSALDLAARVKKGVPVEFVE
jgi:lipoprotein-anchoring transpeptidase ErfK/SrfK